MKKIIFSLLLTFGVLVSTSQAALIHHYECEGNSNDTQGNTDLAWTGVASYAAGKVGASACNFDSTNSLDTAGLTIGATTTMTLSFWVNNPTSEASESFVTFSGGGTNEVYWENPNEIRFYDDTGLLSGHAGYSTATWYHIAVTSVAGAGLSRYYINGVEVGTSVNDFSTAATITFAAFSHKYQIDDIKIYDTEESPAAIAALAIPPAPAPSVAAPVSPLAYIVLTLGIFAIGVRQSRNVGVN